MSLRDVSEDAQLAWALEQSRLAATEREQLERALVASTHPPSRGGLSDPPTLSPSLPPPPLPPPPPPLPSSPSSSGVISSSSSGVYRISGAVHDVVWGKKAPDGAVPLSEVRQRCLAQTGIRHVEGTGWFVDVAAIPSRQRPASILGPFESEGAARAATRHDVPPVWDDDSRCARCSVGFGILRRRSHCRNCGHSVCKSCTKQWPRAALPASYVEGDSHSSVRVCLLCDAAAAAFRRALLGGDVGAVEAAFAAGGANVNLRCAVPPAGADQPALLLPVHLAAAADALPTLRWLAEEQHCALGGTAGLSLGKPAKSVLRVAIEARATDCLQWLVGADDAPAHCALPLPMPADTGCATAAVHRALAAALADGYRQRRLLNETIAAACDSALTRARPLREPSEGSVGASASHRGGSGRQAQAGSVYTSDEAPATLYPPIQLEPSAHGASSTTPASVAGRPNDSADADRAEECVVCLAAPRECVFLECGHACVCEQCGGTLANCPICRAPIVRLVRMYPT